MKRKKYYLSFVDKGLNEIDIGMCDRYVNTCIDEKELTLTNKKCNGHAFEDILRLRYSKQPTLRSYALSDSLQCMGALRFFTDGSIKVVHHLID